MRMIRRTWLSGVAAVALGLGLGQPPCGATATYTNLVPGNVASITTDIPNGWWAGGTTPSALTNNSLSDRWLTGNYDATWGSGVGSGGKLWPYHVTLTFTTPVSLSRVREIYNADGGGFNRVDVTAYDSANNVLGQLFNVPMSSAGSWQAKFASPLDNVKKIDFLVKAHGQPTYYDVRLGEVQAFDDGGVTNLARNATVTASSVGYAGALNAAHDEDFASLFYSAGWTGSPQWVLYDFGQPETVGAFRLYHQTSSNYQIKDYQIQIPDGLGGWTSLYTQTAPLGTYYEIFTLPASISASQVRLYVTALYPSPDARMRFQEFEILQPEPASCTLLVLAGAGLLARRARRS